MFTAEEKDFYNPTDRVAPCNRIEQIDGAMTEATSHLAMILFGIERYGRVIASEHAVPPLHKDMALNLTDPENRKALRDALDGMDGLEAAQ